jgi:hypothetical protein
MEPWIPQNTTIAAYPDMFRLLAMKVYEGELADGHSQEDAIRVSVGLLMAADDGDVEAWKFLLEVYRFSLHSSCCGGVPRAKCFRSRDSKRITKGKRGAEAILTAEIKASQLVCNDHHQEHTRNHGGHDCDRA